MVQPIRVEKRQPFSGWNEESADNYFRAKNEIELLNKVVIQPFEQKLKQHTNYDSDNLPLEKDLIELNIGDHVFKVLNETRINKPKTSEVYNNLVKHLQFLESTHSEGINRKGVFTFNEEPYMGLEGVIDKIHNLKELVVKKGLKQSITHEGPDNYGEILMIPFGNSLELNENGSSLYGHSKYLISVMKSETVKPFEDLIKSQTHYNKDNVPEEMIEKPSQLGKHYFILKVIPEKTVKYTDILNSLVKQTKRVTKNTGELVLLKLNEMDKIDEELESKVIVNFYKPETKAGEIYISIPGTLERLDYLKSVNTNPSVNTRLEHFPVV